VTTATPVPSESNNPTPIPAAPEAPVQAAPVKRAATAQPLSLPRQAATPAAAPAAAPPSPPRAIDVKPKPQSAQGSRPRADIPPASGFTLVVDGHFKNQYDDASAAQSAGTQLRGKFPMLRVEIYDAVSKTRTPV
jgi:hypothetical protein